MTAKTGEERNSKLGRFLLKLSLLFILVAAGVSAASVVVSASYASGALSKLAGASAVHGRAAAAVEAVIAVAAVGLLVYSGFTVFRNDAKGLRLSAGGVVISGVVLLALGVALDRPREQDEVALSYAVLESFHLSHSQTRLEEWDYTQQKLECCGAYGPEDYRRFGVPAAFPPDVPASCCANALGARGQDRERERELCRQQRLYNRDGCVKTVGTTLATFYLALYQQLIVFFVLSVFVGIVSLVLSHTMAKSQPNTSEDSAMETKVDHSHESVHGHGGHGGHGGHACIEVPVIDHQHCEH